MSTAIIFLNPFVFQVAQGAATGPQTIYLRHDALRPNPLTDLIFI